ncbi:helix-turn-helix domain-containing protein [Raineyella sp. LH-20]|uniref:helix-turn-helix domain-containing protein n=1 Tax=Raineyella sp. LH-20 TaxID=3081204 RepID=UPI002952C6FA|nr:helix-turn-helix domain-containing protein [Raineyella sp. LH-20]WOP18917.1 hypothetical protein R0146_01175 [Raineyella sp. LH-20]
MEIRDVTLGERIAEGRGRRGLTQERLAYAADLSHTAIAKICTSEKLSCKSGAKS